MGKLMDVMNTLKEIKDVIKQRCDDISASFHNNLTALLIIQLLSILVFVSVIVSPFFIFEDNDNLGKVIFEGINIILSPVFLMFSFYLCDSAAYHFYITLDNRISEWID